MSSSISEGALRRRVVGTALAFAVATVVFHETQNRFGLIGGAISFAKSAWLAEALFLWLVLPAFLLLDARMPAALRVPFRFLLWWMGARAVVELWLLYVTHTWSPLYGIAHDLVAMAVLWLFAMRAWRAQPRWHGETDRLMFVHTLVTGALFIPEMYYAWYMWFHFNTQGGQAVYFVPDDPRHQLTLSITAAVDVALVIYLIAFLWIWLHGETRRNPARA